MSLLLSCPELACIAEVTCVEIAVDSIRDLYANIFWSSNDRSLSQTLSSCKTCGFTPHFTARGCQ